MGFFKKLKEGFDTAREQVKQNIEEARELVKQNIEEARERLEEQQLQMKMQLVEKGAKLGSNDDDDEPRIQLGKFENGVLEIREGITKIDDDSLEGYKHLRKIIFPASLEEIDDDAIDEQEELEELDFSRVTKLKTIPDSMVCCETKITQLIIPYGVTKMDDYFLREANPGTKVYVPDTVKEMGSISGNSNNDLIVYLFAHNLDVEDMEQDVKTLYVLPQDYASYARKLKDCDSEVRLREMPEEAMSIYPAAKPEPHPEPKVITEPKPKPKSESNSELKPEPQKEETPGTSDDSIFSARLEMLIKSALKDGVLTDQERAILKKRAEKEGEDWDEVEMIIEARLAEIQTATKNENADSIKTVSVNSESIKSSQVSLNNEASHPVNQKILNDKTYYNDSTVIIPEGYTEIGEEAFGWSKMQRVVLPSTLLKIGKKAFMYCEQLNEVDSSSCLALKEIGEEAFLSCKKIKRVVLPASLEAIGEEAFSNCEQLSEVDFSGCLALKEIGKRAFSFCGKLREVVLPASLEEMGDDIFLRCDSLKSIDVSKVKRLKTIPRGFGSDNEKQIIIPMGASTIENRAFWLILHVINKLFLPPTLENYEDTKRCFGSIYLFTPQFDDLEAILSVCRESLYVLPQYLNEYKAQQKAIGEFGDVEILPMPDEYLYFYDN